MMRWFARCALLGLGLGLVGCASVLENQLGTARPEPLPSPSPYRFSLGSFTDARSAEDQDRWQSPVPFRTAQFMQGWQQVWRTATFGETPALLDVILKNYSASKGPGGDYALSAQFDLAGRLPDGQPLGSTAAMCSVVLKPGFQLDDQLLAMQTASPDDMGHGCHALAPCATEARLWRLAMTNCARQVAGQFGQAIHTQGSSSTANYPKERSCGNRAC